MTVAGAQFTDSNINSVLLEIKKTLDDMIENDEL